MSTPLVAFLNQISINSTKSYTTSPCWRFYYCDQDQEKCRDWCQEGIQPFHFDQGLFETVSVTEMTKKQLCRIHLDICFDTETEISLCNRCVATSL